MSIGFWVVCAVVLFVIGNVMALKPPIHETRLTTLRLHARQLGLMPKLVATPDWLKPHLPKQPNPPKMLACYTLVNDAWQLPLGTFVAKDALWQCTPDTKDSHPLRDTALDTTLAPYLVGLSSKANSVSVFFYDERYVKSFAIRDKSADSAITQSLDELHEYLTALASLKLT